MGGLGECSMHWGDEVRLRLWLNSSECVREGGGGLTLWSVGKAGCLEGFGGHE